MPRVRMGYGVPGNVGIHVNVGCFGRPKPEGWALGSVGSVQDKRYRSRENLVIVIYLLAIDKDFQKHAVTGLPIHT